MLPGPWPAVRHRVPKAKSFDLNHLQYRRHLLERWRHVHVHFVQKGKQSFLHMKPELREAVFKGSIHFGFRMIVLATSLFRITGQN